MGYMLVIVGILLGFKWVSGNIQPLYNKPGFARSTSMNFAFLAVIIVMIVGGGCLI